MKPVRQDSQAIVIRWVPIHLYVLAGVCLAIAVAAALRFYPERAELPASFPLFPATFLALAVGFAIPAEVITARFDQARRSLVLSRRGPFGGFRQEVPFEAIETVRVATRLYGNGIPRLALEAATRQGEALHLGHWGLGQQARLEAVAKQLRKFVGHSAQARPYQAALVEDRRARRRRWVVGGTVGAIAVAASLLAWG